ncbi:unnamed protein product [Calypogeia fissa]
MSQGAFLLAVGSHASGLTVTSLKSREWGCCKTNNGGCNSVGWRGASSGGVLPSRSTGGLSSHSSASCSKSYADNYLNVKTFRHFCGERASFGSNSKNGRWRHAGQRMRVGRVRVGGVRRRNGRVVSLWGLGQQRQEEQQHKGTEDWEDDTIVIGGPLTSIGDFTRFRDKGTDGSELQTAIITYRKPFPWCLFDRQQVDLVAAVHIADKQYFSSLQEELTSYDRVLYEMVADKNPRHTNRNVKYRWRPPKRRPGRSGGGFSIIGTIQKLMASILTLDFQLNCMDYRRENWYHADLDFETFQSLQLERGETFFSFARDLTEISTKTIMRNLNRDEDLEPWRSKLLWVSRVFPMPLVGLLIIEVVCAPSNAPLAKSPEMKALLEFDIGSALKVFLAKQISTDLTSGASSLVENSVIIGERNRVAMDELHQALHEGCRKIAVFYGSGHLPDMDARLRREFGLYPADIQWRTAWSIKRRGEIQQDALGDFLGTMARVSGWPLSRYQTMALLFISAALAVDLYFWELLLGAVNDGAQQVIIFVVNFLEQGWGL